MGQHITQYASSVNGKLTYHGMVHGCVSRNFAAMKPNNLKRLRGRADLKQAIIAERVGVSEAQVSRWESGKDAIPSTRLPSLAKAYDAAIGELFEPASAMIPTEAELAQLLESSQRELPAGLPFSEWPQSLAEAFRRRLALLLDDRATPGTPKK